jgi:hypothetical protein
MATMRAVQVAERGGPFELVERDVPSPGRRLSPRDEFAVLVAMR